MNVLITGASSGIGAALARKMVARGLDVWLAARRLDRLEAEVAALGPKAHALALDVTRPDEAARAVEQLDDDIGGVDLVVANAGIGGPGRSVARTTWQDVQNTLATNVVGSLATMMPLVPRMIGRFEKDSSRRGHIAAVSSTAAELPLPAAADYGTSKAALSFFLACAQGDLPRRGVDVTIIHPGFVKTDLTAKNKFPMPFLVEADEAARIMDDGLKRRARWIRFPLGTVALITAGKLLPSSLKDAVVGRASRAGARPE